MLVISLRDELGILVSLRCNIFSHQGVVLGCKNNGVTIALISPSVLECSRMVSLKRPSHDKQTNLCWQFKLVCVRLCERHNMFGKLLVTNRTCL